MAHRGYLKPTKPTLSPSPLTWLGYRCAQYKLSSLSY